MNDLTPGGGGVTSAAQILARLIGAGTLAAGALLYGAGTSTLSTLSIGAANTVLTSSGTAPQWSTSLALTGTIASKQSAAAGISLDHNSATGNFTMRLSPANLTDNRRTTFGDADFSFTGGGTLALGGFTLTVPATGTAALLGTAQTFTANQAISGGNSFTLNGNTASPFQGFVMAGTTTSPLWQRITNTGGGIYFGLEGSVASTLITGSTAYGAQLSTSNVTPLEFGVNNTVVGRFLETGEFRILNSSASNSTASGAMIVAGGAAVVGNIFCGGRFASDKGNSNTPLESNWFLSTRSGYCGFRQNTSNELCIDVDNTGVPIEAFRISQAGVVSVPGTANINGVTISDNASYGLVALNGTTTLANVIGMYGAGSGDDQLYINTVSGASIQCRVANVQKLTVEASTITVNPSTASTSTATGALVVVGGIAGGGSIYHGGHTLTTDVRAFDSAVTWNAGGVTFTGWKLNVTDTASAASSVLLDLQVGGSSKAKIGKTGALTLTGGTVTLSTPLLVATQTWNDGGSIFTAWKLSVTNTASAAASMLFDLQVDGASRIQALSAGYFYQYITTGNTTSRAQGNIQSVSSTGTPGNGFGVGNQVYMETSTTDIRSALDTSVTWADATDASRKARARWEIWDTSPREALRIEASGSAAMIGFLGASAVARATMAAATGTATRTTFDTTTVTTAQLAERVKALIDDLRSYGLHG